MNITESIKFDKLKEENEELKNKISEKDKEIAEKDKEIEELKEELKEELILKENQIKNLNLRHERELEKELNSWKKLAAENLQQIEFLKIEIREYKKTELYKEDFCVSFYCERDYEGGFILDVDNDMSEEDIIEEYSTEIVQKIIQLKYHSKYDLLLSKDELK
ncbi:hypothetical protein [Spiroplasma endosymbiont of Stenodema calcarata]|uniref:hypothetical protein n=1 Tax=Spiroplasma endosymbiont of Stenodema calcarata TaxID=3139328 RepID=UPI003CCA84F7